MSKNTVLILLLISLIINIYWIYSSSKEPVSIVRQTQKLKVQSIESNQYEEQELALNSEDLNLNSIERNTTSLNKDINLSSEVQLIEEAIEEYEYMVENNLLLESSEDDVPPANFDEDDEFTMQENGEYMDADYMEIEES